MAQCLMARLNKPMMTDFLGDVSYWTNGQRVERCRSVKRWTVHPEVRGSIFGLVISVYLLSLPVAHLSGAPRKRLVVTVDSARIQDETTENSAWFFYVLGV